MKNVTTVIGRQREKIDCILVSGQEAFLAIYGRRRVGKTFLVWPYLKEHIVFDFTGTRDGTNEQQLHNFFYEYLKRTRGKAETQPTTSWQVAFKYLAI